MVKTNKGLVEYVKSKLNFPTIYMLGGFGRKLTQADINRRVNLLKCKHTIANLKTITNGIGKYCFDCVGLIKGYLWEESPGNVRYNVPVGSDQNVKGMYNSATEKGLLKNMPDIVGLLVFTANLGHVGVYVGKNSLGERQYVEATPAFNKWGVCRSNDSIRKWTYWGKYHLIKYIVETPKEKDPEVPVKTGTFYVVKQGDSLWNIANRYGTTVSKLVKDNNIVDPDKIGSGDKIVIR